MDAFHITKQARDAGVRLIRFLYTDNGGVIRGKLTHINGLQDRITDGIGSSARSECSTAPLRTMISAFSFSTSTTARRIGTTQSGSKLALSSSALPKRSRPPSPALAVRRQSTGGCRVEDASSDGTIRGM